jgi:hypothetical protein
MNWWSGESAEEAPDPSEEYGRYLTSIRDRLPADLLATQETVALHDCRLREARMEIADSSFILVLETFDGDESLTLTYRGVTRLTTVADPAIGLGGPAGYGDLGYTEVEVLPAGTFEHRLLFSSGIELGVVFSDFRWERDTKTT